jgi:hypothetical protein
VTRTFARAVWRLVRFDVRRFRVLLAAVVGLELARAALVEWSLQFAPTVIGERFGGLAGQGEVAALDTAIWLATCVATAVLVQGDHPSDDRAFWRSRPIPPVALAVAKLTLFAGLFVMVPSVVSAVRLIAYGAPADAPIAAALYFAAVAALTVVMSWSVAIVTRTLVRFIAACLGLVVAFYLALAAYAYYQRYGAMSAVGVGLEPSAGSGDNAWSLTILLVAGLAILVLHYRLRKPAIAAVAGLAVVVGTNVMPGSTTSRPAPPALAAAVAGRLTLPEGLTTPAETNIRGYAAAANGWPIFLQGRVGFPALPEDISAGVILRKLMLRAGDGTVQAVGARQCCSGRGAVGVITPQDPPAEPGQRPRDWGFGSIDLSDVEAVRAGHLAVDGEATVLFVRHHLVGAIPLRAGSAFRGDRYLVEVLAIEPRRAVALLRVARFPTLDSSDRPLLTFFESDRARAHVATTSTPYPLAGDGMGDSSSWGAGRQWVDRLHLPIHRRSPPPEDPQLLIVESRSSGETRTTLAARDVPVGVARPD